MYRTEEANIGDASGITGSTEMENILKVTETPVLVVNRGLVNDSLLTLHILQESGILCLNTIFDGLSHSAG